MIELPIKIDEHGDVTLFWSVAEAESYLEPIDVDNNEVVASDGGGRPLLLTVVEDIRPMFFGLFKMRHRFVKISDLSNTI